MTLHQCRWEEQNLKETTSYNSVSTCQCQLLGIQACKAVVLIIFALLIKHGKIQGKENEGK